METENSGVPCPDSLKSDDNEGDIETEESEVPCPDSLKTDDSISQSTTPVSKNQPNPETYLVVCRVQPIVLHLHLGLQEGLSPN